MFDKIVDTRGVALPTHEAGYVYADWRNLPQNKYIIKDGGTDIRCDAPSYQWVKLGELEMTSALGRTSSYYDQGTLSESMELGEGEALGFKTKVTLNSGCIDAVDGNSFKLDSYIRNPWGGDTLQIPSDSLAARQAFKAAGGYAYWNYIPGCETGSRITGLSISLSAASAYEKYLTLYYDSSYYSNHARIYCMMYQDTDFVTGDYVLKGRLITHGVNHGDNNKEYGYGYAVDGVTVEVYKYKLVTNS